MKVLVIIPAYNEEKSIKSVVDKLRSTCPAYDYIIVNDGSKDRTIRICKENGYPVLDLPVNLGLSGGFQTGVQYAYKHGYDLVIQFDGDGQHEPKYIECMIDTMEHGRYDIVIGSRFVTRQKPRTLRMIGSNLISLAILLTTGAKISDPTSGMRLYNSRMIAEFANNINYGPEPDTISYLVRCGAKVSEVQVEMLERTAGESYLNIWRSMRYMINIIVSIFIVQPFRRRG